MVTSQEILPIRRPMPREQVEVSRELSSLWEVSMRSDPSWVRLDVRFFERGADAAVHQRNWEDGGELHVDFMEEIAEGGS